MYRGERFSWGAVIFTRIVCLVRRAWTEIDQSSPEVGGECLRRRRGPLATCAERTDVRSRRRRCADVVWWRKSREQGLRVERLETGRLDSVQWHQSLRTVLHLHSARSSSSVHLIVWHRNHCASVRGDFTLLLELGRPLRRVTLHLRAQASPPTALRRPRTTQSLESTVTSCLARYD
jgi:hypothetical protein